MRTIAFDVGGKRVGIATSDPTGTVASPVGTFERGDDASEDARELCAIAARQQAEEMVVGMPVSLRGQEEIAALAMREFAGLLSRYTDIPIVLWDERMSTVIAERALLESGMSREGRKGKRDMVAAAIILQNYLDSRRP